MNSASVFISIMTILLIFNWLYVSANPSVTNTMLIGAVTGLVSTVVAISVIAGLQAVGSGFNSASIKILFGVGSLLQILFSLSFTIAGIDIIIGLGLINNLFNAFSGGDLLGIGFFLSTLLGILALVSGLIIVIGGGE